MAKNKYHINDKGEPGVCKAIHNCRFGEGVFDHYPTAELAREAYEEHMQATASFGQAKKDLASPPGFEPTAYVGPNGDIAIAEALGDSQGNVVYRRAGSDDWQAVTSEGRLMQAETPSGRYATAQEAAEALGDATPAVTSPIAFDGTEEHQELRHEQLQQYLQQAQSASTSLEASKYYWYALGLGGKGEGQKELHNAFEATVKKSESSWKSGEKFDTSIEGPISLTNKAGLVTTDTPGVYSTPSGDYMVWRRGAGPAVALSKSKWGWKVSSGPGSFQFIASNKREGRKAAQALEAIEVGRRSGTWSSSLSKEEARKAVEGLTPINPGGFTSSSGKTSLLKILDHLT